MRQSVADHGMVDIAHKINYTTDKPTAPLGNQSLLFVPRDIVTIIAGEIRVYMGSDRLLGVYGGPTHR